MPTLGHYAQIQTGCARTILRITRISSTSKVFRKSKLARRLLFFTCTSLNCKSRDRRFRMSELRDANAATENHQRTNERQEEKLKTQDLTRRTLLGVGSAGIAPVALASRAANAQER